MINYFKTLDDLDNDIDDRLKDYSDEYIGVDKDGDDGMDGLELQTLFEMYWGDNPLFNMLPSWMPTIHPIVPFVPNSTGSDTREVTER